MPEVDEIRDDDAAEPEPTDPPAGDVPEPVSTGTAAGENETESDASGISEPDAVPEEESTVDSVAQPAAESLAEPVPEETIPERATDTGPAEFPRIAAPAVLVGNPRLGSNPAALPATAEPAADSVLDGAEFDRLVVRAASVRGDEHRHYGDTRQDSMGIWSLEPPAGLDVGHLVFLGCVADGVGSQPLSQLGSTQACRLLRQHVVPRLPELLSPAGDPAHACAEVMSEVAAGLRTLAAGLQAGTEQVATTLVAGLVTPGGPGTPARVVLFRVGDGTCFVLRNGSWQDLLGELTVDGPVLSTATDALPMHPKSTVATVVGLEPGDLLLLCTDGLAKPMMLNASVRDQLAAWWGAGQVPSLPEFYGQMSFRAQTFGDDRSAVCVWLNDHG